MKIKSIRIENFRSYKDETIHFDDYTCLVGCNGSGKSTIINALNIFFRQYKDNTSDLSKLAIEDFHHKDILKPIKITVTFTDLSDKAKEDLSDYVRHEQLIITAEAIYDNEKEVAEVKQYGNRLIIEEFRKFFEAEKNKANVAELRQIFSSLQEEYPQLESATTKSGMIEALHNYEASHSAECKLTKSEDQFYGVSKGVNRLQPHVQWIFISASKDVIEEGEESRTTALGQLLARTVRTKVNFQQSVTELRNQTRERYQSILDSEQTALKEISTALQQRLTSWSHPNITAEILWKEDPEKSVKIEEPFAYLKIGERDFSADLSRFGHGLQRSYMLALLQELAMLDQDNAPTLIMGIEEPEIYQHPPQARYLAETLIELSEKNAQLVLCTHNPLFIPGDNFDKIRIVKEIGSPSYTNVKSLSYETLAKELATAGEKPLKEKGMVAKLYPSLDPITNEMFFCKILILVEGYEDIAYIMSYLMLTGQILEFRKYGCHIVPANGKSRLIKPLAMAKLLDIPVFVVFDGDSDKSEDQKPRHQKENKILLALKDYSSESDWPTTTILKNDLICWNTNLTQIIKTEFGNNWEKYRTLSSKFYDNACDLEKNPLAIAKLLELAWADNVQSNVLIDLIDRIITFAQLNSPAAKN